MTQQEQRIALAEWAGWTKATLQVQSFVDPSKTIPHERWLSPLRVFSRTLPNYHADLDEVHVLEKGLDINMLSRYADALDAVCVPTHICPLTHWASVTMSTAAERCEALCRVLWPERFL